MQTATVDPLVGRTLEGRYRIVDRIARGGMSTVYSAVDERLDRMVAVKVMSSALSADPAFSDRFTREARAAARLTHMNVVSVYDQGADVSPAGHHVFLVMELVEGRTLRDLLRERGRLSPELAVSIMEPVLGALSAAHRAGLVHRDIKPENILLSDDGVVKVADFGLARAVESDAAATRTGLMMGTVAYCAPEQISKGRADQRSDVYSAGIVLFELLTGRPPYQGESAMTVAYQHVHSRVPAPSSIVRGVPSEIDELVVTATDSDPAGRPLDAGAFLALVADTRRDLDLPVVPVPRRERPRTRPGDPGGVTTDVLRGRGGHDTSVVPGRSTGPTPVRSAPLPGRSGPLPGRSGPLPGGAAPPPPVVIPPKRRKPPSVRARRRRRALLGLVLLVVLGVLAGYAGWWFAAGRYSRVPDVRGDTQAAAVQNLRDAGYDVASAVTMRFSETVARGRVISTDPDSGARLLRGKPVALVVSSGKERFSLPKVAGKSAKDARAALAGIPVQVVATQASNDTVPKGTTIGTDPAAGTQVKRNQVVKLLISTGPPIIGIPNVDPGTPYATAKQRLEDAGFTTKRVEDFSTSIPKEGVISISPTGSAVKFSAVTITVSKGPQQVTIPDFGALPPLDEVQRQLQDLGLKVRVEKAFGGRTGRVVGVDPPTGTLVDIGSTVTVTIV